MKTTLALILTLLLSLSGYGAEATISVTEKDTQWIGTLDTVTGKVTKTATLPKRTDVKDPRNQQQEEKLRDIVFFENKPLVWRGSWQSTLVTFDGKDWKEIPAPQNTSNGSAGGGMEVTKKDGVETLYLSDMSIGGEKMTQAGLISYIPKTDQKELFALGNTFDIAIEGNLAFAIIQRNPKTVQLRALGLKTGEVHPLSISSPTNNRLLAVAVKGEHLFFVDGAGFINKVSISSFGSKPLARLAIPAKTPISVDMDIAEDGTLMVGAFTGKVFITTVELEKGTLVDVTPKGDYEDTVFGCFKKVEKPSAPPRPKGGSNEGPQYAVVEK